MLLLLLLLLHGTLHAAAPALPGSHRPASGHNALCPDPPHPSCWPLLLGASPGGGRAGGFIRVAISFLEPDQVRNGDLEGGGAGRKAHKRRVGGGRAGSGGECGGMRAAVSRQLVG